MGPCAQPRKQHRSTCIRIEQAPPIQHLHTHLSGSSAACGCWCELVHTVADSTKPSPDRNRCYGPWLCEGFWAPCDSGWRVLFGSRLEHSGCAQSIDRIAHFEAARSEEDRQHFQEMLVGSATSNPALICLYLCSVATHHTSHRFTKVHTALERTQVFTRLT